MIRLTLAALLLAGSTHITFADSNKAALAPGSLTAAQVTQKLQSQGYTVNKVEFDDGSYKVKAISPSKQKTKLQVDAANGSVLNAKVDDGKD